MLLEVRESVISLGTFPFVERHYTEFANVPGFAPFFVNCTNMVWPSRILPLALFDFTICARTSFHISPESRPGGPHEAYVELELTVHVALSLCLTLLVPPPSVL
jgi:hypothetical protein